MYDLPSGCFLLKSIIYQSSSVGTSVDLEFCKELARVLSIWQRERGLYEDFLARNFNCLLTWVYQLLEIESEIPLLVSLLLKDSKISRMWLCKKSWTAPKINSLILVYWYTSSLFQKFISFCTVTFALGFAFLFVWFGVCLVLFFLQFSIIQPTCE